MLQRFQFSKAPTVITDKRIYWGDDGLYGPILQVKIWRRWLTFDPM